jgi:signal transduction histidine kinase/ligand-binding sensor domain-containing protein
MVIWFLRFLATKGRISLHSNARRCLAQCRRPLWPWYLVLLAFILSPASAKERAYHVFDQSNGLPVSWLSGFTQDTNGFFWFGTAAGLYRFDGVEFRHWAKGKISGWHYQVFPGPNGEVLLTSLPDSTLYRVLPNEDAEVVKGTDGKPFTNVQSASFTRDGRFWVARLDALFFRDEQSELIAMPEEIHGNERIWKVSASWDDALWVATTHSIWRVAPDLSYKKILTRIFDGFISNVIAHPDGSLFYMEEYPDGGGKILQWRDGQITESVSLKANLQDFVLRGETVWANGDHYMVVFRPSQRPEVLEAGKDAPIGGAMLVDHERSLWMGTGREVFQVPEPETEIWTAHDGLPAFSPLALHETAEGVWVSTWNGLGHLERRGDWHVYDDHLGHIGELCSDGQGHLWVFDEHHFWERRLGRFIKHQAGGDWGGCDRASDGSVWMTTSQGLWRTVGLDAPVLVAHPFGDRAPGKVFEDSRKRVWVTSNEDICQAPGAALNEHQQVSWNCQNIKGARSIGKPVELPDGSLWTGTDMLGIWRYTEDTGWTTIPASSGLVSQSIARLVLSPRGGVWVLGMTARVRVLPSPHLTDGWQVVEELSPSLGIPAVRIYDLIEEDDGSLWVATLNGIAHLPAGVRYEKVEPPRIVLTGLLINGQRIDASGALRIPAGRNQVELRFAALSYRDRSLLRYQYKLHSREDWTPSSDNLPVFRFYDLRSGAYSVEVRASLDGVNWSSVPAQISFEILPHWYLRWWAIALFVSLIGLVLVVVHRVRVRGLLQLARQRARIAMDLHDEIGSGLGSIGILSSVAASSTIGEAQRQEMSRRIAATAGELGTSLTDIVWSLRVDATTIESLASHLTRRAESLFANDRTQLTTRFPDKWQSINLSLPARRNILLIATESLHNAAKHARAENVTLLLAPAEGRKWLMRIEDDGCGLGKSNGNHGMGMETMRHRAAEIGAQLVFHSKNGRGTIVSLTFDPQSKDRG